ncbi:DUF2953 domain-containing protein [Paenactinomyces guangxiensis]|uniref:DUF2953 domain-containing protein n=1 Tax=Paenactinomyces guangxiensis TaxID=1490290 RepID=A0A7W1WT87_9BACL|nr:DUF2953 domain-containing protein [Paenactinomyces guangxiensis]MBA4495653.1 DUF2953 domain-containing protein [Paenactinomyces guangxiensis]MBH8592641.1 DUF2953 domain-containing protein [Paenactinomyces guangxiensis]
MKIFLMVMGILTGLFMIIWITSVRVEMIFKRENGNDRGEVTISAWGGLIRFRMKIPRLGWGGINEGVKLEGEAESVGVHREKEADITKKTVDRFRSQYQQVLDHIEDFQRTVRWFLSKVTCEKLVWVTTIGTGDAAESGILTGIVWGIKTTLVGMLSGYTRWDQSPLLYVEPHFSQPVLETHLHSIIRFRVGHAILGITRLLLHLRKGRERKWQSTPFRA